MSISVGLDIAVRALLAQQLGADTVAHNIANVNTDGYSRQRLGLEAVPGPQTGYGSGGGPGRGVTSIGVERVRDMFADFQFRDGAQTSGRLDARATFLQRAELVIGEPGDSGIRSVLSRYWNAWRDVATSPESSAARTVLVQSGETLATTASRIHTSLTGLRRDANTALLGDVDQINALANEIYALNKDIQVIALRGGATNDLRDRRDLALDRLSTLTDINIVEQSDSRIDVFIGGHSLVSSSSAHALYGDPNIANSNFVDVRFVEDNALLNVGDGEVRGLLDMRDTDLVSRIADLNALIGQVITDVNVVHTAGYGLDALTGRAFFTGSDASDIAIDAGLMADPSTVAASTSATGVPGDGANAQAVADLQYSTPLGGGLSSYDEFYANFISDLGAATRETEALLGSQDLVNRHIQQVRDGASGVNLDEEMVQLMRYQRAYEGAARMISVIDEMLEALIHGTR